MSIQKMSVWFGDKTRAKVQKYEDYPILVPLVQVPIALIILAAGLGLTPDSSGHLVIAILGALWAGRLSWTFYRIAQVRRIKRQHRRTPYTA